jgi:hypothetical protein
VAVSPIPDAAGGRTSAISPALARPARPWATPRGADGGAPGVTYLVRPDRRVAAGFARHDPDAVGRALARATLKEPA